MHKRTSSAAGLKTDWEDLSASGDVPMCKVSPSLVGGGCWAGEDALEREGLAAVGEGLTGEDGWSSSSLERTARFLEGESTGAILLVVSAVMWVLRGEKGSLGSRRQAWYLVVRTLDYVDSDGEPLYLDLPKPLPPTLLKDMSLAPAIDISAHTRHRRQSPPAPSFFASPGLILVSGRVLLSSPARQPNCARTSQNEATARTAPSAPSTTPVGSPFVTLHNGKPKADSKMVRSPACQLRPRRRRRARSTSTRSTRPTTTQSRPSTLPSASRLAGPSGPRRP